MYSSGSNAFQSACTELHSSPGSAKMMKFNVALHIFIVDIVKCVQSSPYPCLMARRLNQMVLDNVVARLWAVTYRQVQCE